MTGRAGTVAVLVLALAHLGVLVTPALVLAAAADKGAVPGTHGTALFAASAVVGTGHAIATMLRARNPHDVRHARNLFIAAFDGLVVLALLSTLLLFIALGAYAPLGIVLVNRGWSVLVAWVGAQVVAVLVAERTRGAVFAWLEAEHDDGEPIQRSTTT